MPDSAYAGTEVHCTYAQLEKLHAKAKKVKICTIIGGDWNATLGTRRPGEEDTQGVHGNGSRNARGELMANWASEHKLAITSTFFEHREEDAWTYHNGGHFSELDYIALDIDALPMATSAKTSEAIGTGLDHRTVESELEWETTVD